MGEVKGKLEAIVTDDSPTRTSKNNEKGLTARAYIVGTMCGGFRWSTRHGLTLYSDEDYTFRVPFLQLIVPYISLSWQYRAPKQKAEISESRDFKMVAF